MYLLLLFFGVGLQEAPRLLQSEVKDIITSTIRIKFVDETRFLVLGFNDVTEKWELIMYKINYEKLKFLDRKVITTKNNKVDATRDHSGISLSRNKDKAIVFGTREMVAAVYLIKKEKLLEDASIDIIGDNEPRYVFLTEDENKIIMIFRFHKEEGFITRIRVQDVKNKEFVDTDMAINKMRFGDCIYKNKKLIMFTAVGIFVWEFDESGKAILQKKYPIWSYDSSGIWRFFDDALKIHLIGENLAYCCYRNFLNQLVCCEINLNNYFNLKTKVIEFMFLPKMRECTGFYDLNSNMLVKIEPWSRDSIIEVRRSGTTVLSKKIEGSLMGYDINEKYIAFCTKHSKKIFVIVK